MARSRAGWVAGGATLLAATFIVPQMVAAQDADGFDGYIQSGTCAEPTDDLRVKLDGQGDHDIEPYLARTGAGDETVVLGYYGAPGVPGFGVGAVYYSEQQFSMVITDAETGDPVACGDLLQPDADRYRESGVAVVQLLPVGSGSVHGVATLERAKLEREHDVTPTQARIVLSTEDVGSPAQTAEGYDGYVQSGPCSSPTTDLRVNLRSQGDHDIKPFLAEAAGSDEVVTLAYYGAPGVGFGFGMAYTDREFSLVISDTDSGDAMACGAVLEPDDDKFTEAGLALVQLLPLDDSGVQGFALIDRAPLERELDVTPTRVRTLLFAPPVATG